MFGLMGAGVLGVIFVIIVGISIARAPKPTHTGDDLFGADPSEIPDITETQTGGAMLVTMVDKNDPTRVAATLKADRFEPIGEGQRRLDRPVSWIYLKDGRAIEVTADFATMLMPDPNEPPESGTLEGNIQIRAFEDPNDLSTPSLVALFDEPVEFERRYLRLRSEGHFNITSDRFDFVGTDLTVILNELRDRVELLEVVQGDRLVIHPGQPMASPSPADTVTNQSQSKPEEEASVSKPRVAQGDSTEPSNDLASAKTDTQTKDNALPAGMNRYHVTIADQVVVSAKGVDEQADEELGRVSADQLELWALLDGSQLAPDAITPIRFVSRKSPDQSHGSQSSTHQSTSDATSAPASTPSKSNPSPTRSPTNTSSSGDVVLTWAGKLVLKPMADDEVGELGNDALAIALTTNPDADEHAGVVFESPERGFTGQSHTIRYWATRGKVRLESIETPGGIIKLRAENAGELFATTLDADLTIGEMILNGRGSMKTVQAYEQPDSKTATIQWTKRARIVFDHDADGITDRLALADFDGAVIAKQFDSLAGEKSGGNRLGALRLVARFDPTKPAEASLEHLTLTKGVLNSERQSMLTGSRIDVAFAPLDDESGVWVDRLVADGQVFARDGESLLKTDHLVADMMQELDGATVMSMALAEGSVDFRGKDQSSANAQRMRMEGSAQKVVLTGSPAQVGQGASKVLGDTIVLNGDRRRIEVNGPGSFEHEVIEQVDQGQSDHPTTSVGHIRVSWKGSMRFDDAIGKLVCNDQVRMVSTPDALSRDTLEANRAQIKLSARPSDDPIAQREQQNKDKQASTQQSIGGDPWAGGLGDGDRVLEWARFSGHAPVGAEPEPVKIESRTYAEDDPSRVVGLMYLEGAQVLADNIKQTLHVPTAGVLLNLDRSTQDDDKPSDVDSKPMGDGLTRLAWDGSMEFDRRGGIAKMHESVVVRHKTLSTGLITQLSSDELTARFTPGLGETGAADSVNAQADQSMQLVAIDADGQVRFVYQGRELISDIAQYDALSDTVFASGEGNTLVTLYDDAQPSPMSARTMRWDLTKDRIEINAISPIRGMND